jgi:hypothetical protein
VLFAEHENLFQALPPEAAEKTLAHGIRGALGLASEHWQEAKTREQAADPRTTARRRSNSNERSSGRPLKQFVYP